MESILFLDIETVPAFSSYAEMPERMKKCWDKKAQSFKKTDDDTSESLYQRAGIYAEYGKIVCISVAYMRKHVLRIKSFYGDNENDLLSDFAALLKRYFNIRRHALWATSLLHKYGAFGTISTGMTPVVCIIEFIFIVIVQFIA